MKAIKQLSILGLTGLLVACGGGGGSSSSDNGTDTGNGGTDSGGNNGGQTSTLETELAQWIVDMADGYITPAYQELETASAELRQASLACSEASFGQTELVEIQTAWQQAFDKWQSIQWLRLGPVIAGNNPAHFRIEFQPFDVDAVDRAVFNLLETDEEVTAEYLTDINVRAQGFPALEVLLYPTSSSESLVSASDRAKRCEVVQGISDSLVEMSSQVVTAWSAQGGNYRAEFVNGTGEFTGQVDVVEEVVTNYLEHLELVKDEKLLHPLGDTRPGFPEIAESPRGNVSLAHVKTNIQALIDIYTAKDGHGFDDILNDHLDQTAIATEMSEALTRAQTAINAVSNDFEGALDNDADREALNDVIDALRDFRTVLTADFVQAMDLNIGFNSNDGD